MAIELNGTTGITTPDITSSGALGVDASAPDNSLVVDSSGKVGVGTASPSYRLSILNNGNNFLQFSQAGDSVAGSLIGRSSSLNLRIQNSEAAATEFWTNNTERARIDSSGNLLVGKTTPNTGTIGFQLAAAGTELSVGRSNDRCALFNRRDSNGTSVLFLRDGGPVGSISVTTSSTAYNTSSDYRLKENVVGVTGASARVQQLNPVRFNFIADPDTTVDGFLAHEVQDVVPEAITGTKDAADAEGNPEYQGIDQSKLVPLLTAALQEALGKIETLEARVAALEAA